MLWSTSGNKCRKVVDKSTPPPKESKVMTILFLDFREPASSADIQLNFLARKNGTRPHIMQAQNRTTIDTPLATRTPSVSVAFPPPPPCSASKSAIFFLVILSKSLEENGWELRARPLLYRCRYQRYARATARSDAPSLCHATGTGVEFSSFHSGAAFTYKTAKQSLLRVALIEVLPLYLYN